MVCFNTTIAFREDVVRTALPHCRLSILFQCQNSLVSSRPGFMSVTITKLSRHFETKVNWCKNSKGKALNVCECLISFRYRQKKKTGAGVLFSSTNPEYWNCSEGKTADSGDLHGVTR